ncbi:riboflavin kinase [Plectosphaerella plurivora]|uniref:Riboflavin kinase n=1 Tax=Plectosphaerella plurivora TaxID=936078 RepID=A0A9P8VKI4_9PEZI|nr:riboflavin kinase [Plectosphaerella plurivora]
MDHHDSFAKLGPPPPYTREAIRPSRSVPNLRRQQTGLRPEDAQMLAFPGVDSNGRLRSPSPGPGWEQQAMPFHQQGGGGHYNFGSTYARITPPRSTASLTPEPEELPPPRPPRPTIATAASEPVVPIAAETAQKERNVFKTAFDETVFFAGGLLPHPTESTRHYTILRHSPALVWYRGPSTTVSITIFSDAPLPLTRSLWLQRKGFSGNTGMALKSLVGATTSWLDVTPSFRADVSSLPATDERGYQRDIGKFVKKASSNLKRHLPRETHMVRIPAAAEDGYFRIVLCCGDDGGKRRVLCPSPIFRIASTTTDVSVVRGASLSTMPIEFGVKVGTTIANNVVNKYVGPARLAATAAAAGVVKKVEKRGVLASRAREVALAKAGMRTQYDKMENSYRGTRGAGYAPLQAADGEILLDADFGNPEVLGPDAGPSSPFPIKFDGKVIKGTGRGGMELGIPTANLEGVSEDLRLRMNGVYMAWSCVLPARDLPQDMSYDWHESIVTVGPSPYANPGIVARNLVSVHMIHEFRGAMFYGARVKVLVMGQLRRAGLTDDPLFAYANDVSVTVASLSREAWGPIETRQRMKTLKSERSFGERYLDARDTVQKQVDRVPVHLLGVRSDGAAMRDQTMGHGGVWVQR